MHYGFRNFGFGYGFGWVIPTIFIVIIFVAIIYAFSPRSENEGRKNAGKSGGTEPLEILKERYAKGEINKKEFDQMKKDLN